MSATNTSQYTSTTVWLAPSNSGRWIFKTQAKELWDLAGRDLDSILPRSIAPNRHRGPWNEYKYNESDVANLSVRLNRETFTDVSTNAPLAPRLGPEIKRDDAMSEFRLEDCQMNRIMPVRIEVGTDPDNSTRYYNRIDVVALYDRIENAAANPTCNGQRIPFDLLTSVPDESQTSTHP